MSLGLIIHRKYDLRIADSSEYALREHERSKPFHIARQIADTMHRLYVANTACMYPFFQVLNI